MRVLTIIELHPEHGPFRATLTETTERKKRELASARLLLSVEGQIVLDDFSKPKMKAFGLVNWRLAAINLLRAARGEQGLA